MCNPDWSSLNLNEGVLREAAADGSRLVLWLPGQRDRRGWCWERIGSVVGAVLRADQQLCAVPATSIRVLQKPHALFRKLCQRFQKATDNPTWLLPNGRRAEQEGERQTDLLLVWSDNANLRGDETRIKARWPNASRIQKLGTNLFLVAGVNTSETTHSPVALPPPSVTPCTQARQLLEQARQAGDRHSQASALTDWGAATLASGKVQNALLLLETALKLAREIGDQAREIDALYNLGKAARLAGQSARALQCLSQAVSAARGGGDRFAEKLALEQLGKLYASQGEALHAIAAYEQALELARAVGHRQHQADLLGMLAVLHAEEGRRDQAAALGKAAHDLFMQLGHPKQAKWASGHGLLRMAFSAAKSAVQFVGSGMNTVTPILQQKRLQTCMQCEHHTGVRCKLCGCFTSVKTYLPYETCPMSKWSA